MWICGDGPADADEAWVENCGLRSEATLLLPLLDRLRCGAKAGGEATDFAVPAGKIPCPVAPPFSAKNKRNHDCVVPLLMVSRGSPATVWRICIALNCARTLSSRLPLRWPKGSGSPVLFCRMRVRTNSTNCCCVSGFLLLLLLRPANAWEGRKEGLVMVLLSW